MVACFVMIATDCHLSCVHNLLWLPWKHAADQLLRCTASPGAWVIVSSTVSPVVEVSRTFMGKLQSPASLWYAHMLLVVRGTVYHWPWIKYCTDLRGTLQQRTHSDSVHLSVVWCRCKTAYAGSTACACFNSWLTLVRCMQSACD